MKAFFSLAVGCLISLSAWAQETVAVNTGDIVSPELKNQTVTFKLLASNAKEVVVEADFFERTSNPQLSSSASFLRLNVLSSLN